MRNFAMQNYSLYFMIKNTYFSIPEKNLENLKIPQTTNLFNIIKIFKVFHDFFVQLHKLEHTFAYISNQAEKMNFHNDVQASMIVFI